MRSLVTLVLIVAIFVTSALAQTGDWAAVEGLPSGADISIKTKQGSKYQGNLDSVTPELLILWSQERDFPGRKFVRREIPRADVKQVRLNRRLASVAAGAAIGAGIGVGVGAIADSQARSNEDNGLIGFVLGLLGALIGAGIAKSHPFIKGKTIYLAP